MNRMFKRVGVSILALSFLCLSVPSASAGKLLEKGPAVRKRQAEHRAKKAEKKMAAKKRPFSHG